MDRLDFIYSCQHDAIFCNDALLTKNLPARILGKLLILHLSEGRSEFEHREFKWDRGLFRIAKATNFEVRLQRLMALLSARLPKFHFRKISRGRFCFQYLGETPCTFRIDERYAVSFTDFAADSPPVGDP